MENPIADLVESQMALSGPRMPFFDLCGFHAALALGATNETVAVAAGRSTPAIAYLRHAGERIGGQIRYPRVARERADLGDEAFIRKYLTPKIRDRLEVAISQIKTKKLTPKPPGAIRPNAKRYQGRHDVTAIDGSKWSFLVRLDPIGWLYGVTLEPGRGPIAPEHIQWRGDLARAGRGFATSTEAYGALMSILNPKD